MSSKKKTDIVATDLRDEKGILLGTFLEIVCLSSATASI